MRLNFIKIYRILLKITLRPQVLVWGIFFGLNLTANAVDLGFRFSNGVCQNEKKIKGLNPYFFGQCGDLKGAILGQLDLSGVDFSGSNFMGADLQNSKLLNTTLTEVKFDQARLSGVDFSGAQVFKSSFISATIRNSTFNDTKIKQSDFSLTDFRNSNLMYFAAENSNFKGANLSSVNLTEAQLMNSNFVGAIAISTNFDLANLEAADLSKINAIGASFKKANLKNSNFNEARLNKTNFASGLLLGSKFNKAVLRSSNLKGSTLDQSDFELADLVMADLSQTSTKNTSFKNATYSKRTLLPFNDDEAKKSGLILKNSAGKVFILWDELTTQVQEFAKFLSSEGVEPILAATPEYETEGNVELGEFDALIHFNGTTFGDGLTDSMQVKINAFVQAGGIYVYGEWNAFELQEGRHLKMKELTLLTYGEIRGPVKLERLADKKDASILEGIPASFDLETWYSRGAVVNFAQNPVQVFMKLSTGEPAVALRKYGKGSIVAFTFACTDSSENLKYLCMDNPNVRRLYLNAINLPQ